MRRYTSPNNTMKNYLILSLSIILIAGCSKSDTLPNVTQPETTVTQSTEFINYRILKGNHFCDASVIKGISLTEQNFKVRFDSTAIYKTQTLDNQYDINKLFGFSEGADPHKNSARIGWAYNDDSLRLYGYVYNNSNLITQQIVTCRIGEVLNCSIKLSSRNYIFSVNDKIISLERGATSLSAEGYQLYPYFGGDETAPHDINVFISVLAGK